MNYYIPFMDTYISHFVHISNKGIALNGEPIYQSDDKVGVDMLTDAHKTMNLSYPKFYKMDNLCKLALLATEMLLRDAAIIERYKPEDIAVIVSSAHSSLDTDLRYWDSVVAAASPSLFVYTLPNVMLGEICIRWGIKGENTCFVSDKFNPEFQTDYINGLIATGHAEACIAGWADYLQGEMEAFFMLVEKNPTSLGTHTPGTVQKLYDSAWKN
jgi:3-oxoacyl-(acyl-carrier-protein) synthase